MCLIKEFLLFGFDYMSNIFLCIPMEYKMYRCRQNGGWIKFGGIICKVDSVTLGPWSRWKIPTEDEIKRAKLELL